MSSFGALAPLEGGIGGEIDGGWYFLLDGEIGGVDVSVGVLCYSGERLCTGLACW